VTIGVDEALAQHAGELADELGVAMTRSTSPQLWRCLGMSRS
jgi:hypothetical protein